MLWKMVGRWALVAIAVPVAAAGARRLSQTIETRRGPSRSTTLLRKGADGLQSFFGRSKRRRWGR